jgi:hypothetical protein
MDPELRALANTIRDEDRESEWDVSASEEFCERFRVPLSVLLDDRERNRVMDMAGVVFEFRRRTRYPLLVELGADSDGMFVGFRCDPAIALEDWYAALDTLASALDAPDIMVEQLRGSDFVLRLRDSSRRKGVTGTRNPSSIPRDREIGAPKRAKVDDDTGLDQWFDEAQRVSSHEYTNSETGEPSYETHGLHPDTEAPDAPAAEVKHLKEPGHGNRRAQRRSPGVSDRERTPPNG